MARPETAGRKMGGRTEKVCGIAGFVGAGPPSGSEDPLGRALDVLAARGPDGVGRTLGSLGDHEVRLGVRRLLLVDPSCRQPIERPGGARLVMNGEIYNHRELRRRLRADGVLFRSAGDAEVLAAVLERHGISGLRDVEGSYAFAFLAGHGGPLLLGRDPLGVRPLVFAADARGIVFASTVDALVAVGRWIPRPDFDAIADVLRDGVVPTRRTALQGVRRIAPGEVIHVDRRLGLRAERIPSAQDPKAPAESVLDALRGAVLDRTRAVQGVGVFLSGGVDSALVASLAREAEYPVPTFTVAFPGHAGVDESRRAKRTAARLELEHEVLVCPRDPTPWVLGTARAFDEPFADASAVPTWALGMAAARRVRAVLTGTGGDEVFGGYRRYWLLGTGPWLRHVPAFLRAPLLDVLVRSLPDGARLLEASADPEGLYRGLLRLQPLAELRSLFGPRLQRVADPEPRRGPRTAEEAMADDFLAYLPDDLLVKEDRALMAHGVEGRHPFLDRRVRRAARALELAGGVRRGHQKLVLRAYVREVIDPDLSRVPKRGFAFPVDELYRGPLRDLAGDLLSDRRTRERGFVSTGAALRLLRDHARGTREAGAVLHALVMLELWARRLLDAQPAGTARR